ncbi:hypothetical protein [Microbacterium sp. Root180]|uniref:hypothetical protein n=1 Tax=Microbacterium sp. Root180 TaxID=1736483 RepID=UPI000700507B|nr:hypothetical protein [Microbacterium sp. Root180]KRB37857.1 hypothetical protein ASD93_05895 [Microbacterium sp. Root180]
MTDGSTVPAHGPGVEWLAQRAGVPADELLHDGTALTGALEAAARDGLGLARRLMSADPEERRRAEVEARALRARFAADGPSPEERFAAKIAEAARLLRERAEDSPGPQ